MTEGAKAREEFSWHLTDTQLDPRHAPSPAGEPGRKGCSSPDSPQRAAERLLPPCLYRLHELAGTCRPRARADRGHL